MWTLDYVNWETTNTNQTQSGKQTKEIRWKTDQTGKRKRSESEAPKKRPKTAKNMILQQDKTSSFIPSTKQDAKKTKADN